MPPHIPSKGDGRRLDCRGLTQYDDLIVLERNVPQMRCGIHIEVVAVSCPCALPYVYGTVCPILADAGSAAAILERERVWFRGREITGTALKPGVACDNLVDCRNRRQASLAALVQTGKPSCVSSHVPPPAFCMSALLRLTC